MKDNPLEGATRYGNQTIWLDAQTSIEARDKFWAAMSEHFPGSADKHTWDIAWAAAIAAFSYVQEGRIGPR